MEVNSGGVAALRAAGAGGGMGALLPRLLDFAAAREGEAPGCL